MKRRESRLWAGSPSHWAPPVMMTIFFSAISIKLNVYFFGLATYMTDAVNSKSNWAASHLQKSLCKVLRVVFGHSVPFLVKKKKSYFSEFDVMCAMCYSLCCVYLCTDVRCEFARSWSDRLITVLWSARPVCSVIFGKRRYGFIITCRMCKEEVEAQWIFYRHAVFTNYILLCARCARL